uniref:Uncharacterized protein n=1 Tax=Setaria viridis TaxID=4556 RepID=A0A4U6TIM1_SETVI|nr:hypothetical protein SEVIR_9G476900v2 [Setaria viridis]
MPWTRQVSTSASKLMYRARVYIEGIPEHVQQIETVARLFNAQTFIEEIDNEGKSEQERDCLCLWVWTSNPDGLPKTVTMKVAEPITYPEEYYYQMEGMDLPQTRIGSTEMLDYEVIIHLDRVFDYSPLPSSPSDISAHSGISGTVSADSVLPGMKISITKTLSVSLLGTPIETNTLKKIVRQEKGKENADVNPKEASESKRRSNRLAHRPKTNLIMEEQATVLLMKRLQEFTNLWGDCDLGWTQSDLEWIEEFSEILVTECLGSQFAKSYGYLPADENSVIACTEATTYLVKRWITVVYGPQGDSAKMEFLNEIRDLKGSTSDKWLLLSNFNINRRMMGAFRAMINELELKEINLRGRKYTWTNKLHIPE